MTLTDADNDKLFGKDLRVYDTSMTQIEKTKAEIKVLEAKLSLLEEMEKHKSPAEEAYKRWWGEYPGTETWTGYDETRWVGFQMGYDNAYKETVSKYQPTAQTPEQVAQGLRDAMKTAQSEGVFDKPKPETLTLKSLLKKWEIDFSAKWENDDNKTSELYEEEVERFIQMFIEWMPDANKDYGDGNWEHGWNTGYNAYRNTLMRKLK
jgi:hypothetical protein